VIQSLADRSDLCWVTGGGGRSCAVRLRRVGSLGVSGIVDEARQLVEAGDGWTLPARRLTEEFFVHWEGLDDSRRVQDFFDELGGIWARRC